MNQVFARYLRALRQTARDDKTEHSDRGALEEFLRSVAQGDAPDINVQHEPKRTPGKGAPDFMVTRFPPGGSA